MPRRLGYPQIASLARVLRRAVPAERRKRIRQLMFEWLNLKWAMPSGVELEVANYGDWVTYNEVFVSGEYDRAIERAAEAAGSPMQIVDLGANVGFFSLRAVDRLRGRPLAITAVESEAGFVEDYRARVIETNRVTTARVIHGLIPQVDLSAALAGIPRIDLLKCDIEGGEQGFIETFPDVLAKVRVAVFELHANLCDTERCKRLLAEAGFSGGVLRAGDPYFTYLVWR